MSKGEKCVAQHDLLPIRGVDTRSRGSIPAELRLGWAWMLRGTCKCKLSCCRSLVCCFCIFFCNVFIELFNYIHGFYLFSIYIYIHMNSIPLLLTSKYDSISIDLQVVLHSWTPKIHIQVLYIQIGPLDRPGHVQISSHTMYIYIYYIYTCFLI
jgi:hypothetical protein